MRCLKIWWYRLVAKYVRIKIYHLIHQYQCSVEAINVDTGGEYNYLLNRYNKRILWLKENDPDYPYK